MVPLRLQSFHGKKFERNAQMGGERESCFPISYQELHFIKLRNAFTRASISGGDLQSSCISHCFLELCVTVYRKTEAVRVSAAEQEEESTRISWRWSLVHHQFAALPIVYKIRIKSLRFLSFFPPLFLPSFLSFFEEKAAYNRVSVAFYFSLQFERYETPFARFLREKMKIPWNFFSIFFARELRCYRVTRRGF